MQQLKTRSAGDFRATMRQERGSKRYALKEVVTFSLNEAEPEAVGITENVSTKGILFETEAFVAVGSTIRLDLHLRALADPERTILLRAAGSVSRVEPGGLTNMVAAEIEFQDGYFEENFPMSHTIQ